MSPGIGLMKRRLEKEQDAVSLAISGMVKKYGADAQKIEKLESLYHGDSGDWYVALGWDGIKAVIRMDSVLGKITEIKEV